MAVQELTTNALEGNAKFWDRMAPRYAASAIRDLAGYELTLARVQQELQPGDSVLELGCGTGTTALRLITACCQYTATDVSPKMVAIANAKRQETPAFIQSRLRFLVADADSNQGMQPDGGWDAILAFNLLHLVPDLDRTLSEIATRLRPGGTFLSKTACLAEMNPLLARLALPLARTLRLAPPMQFFTQSQLLAAMERAGFEVVAVEYHAIKTSSRDTRPFVVARRKHPIHQVG